MKIILLLLLLSSLAFPDDLSVPQLDKPQILQSTSTGTQPSIDRQQAHPNLTIPDEDETHLLSLYSYKPIYFLAGNPYAKIQLSFETQIVQDVPVYFGYSQLMLWNIFVPSPFFYDLNYNPLTWYRINFDSEKTEWVDLIPEEHESNGRGGTAEYSWDRIAIAYHRTDRVSEDMKLYTDFKVWYPWHYNSNDLDLAQYRGVWELNMALSGFLAPIFAFSDVNLRIYPGGPSFTDPTAGGQELTLRLRGRKRKFLPLATFQLLHGYGEYLQDYQWSHWGIRAGLGF